MSKKNVSEDYLNKELLNLESRITSSISSAIKIEISSSIKSLQDTVIENLVNENKRLSEKVRILEANFNSLNERMIANEINIADQQQRSRRNNMEIHGIPDSVNDENLEGKVLDVLNSVSSDTYASEDLEACHRLPSKDGPKPVILRFANRKKRDAAFSTKKFLKGKNLNDIGINNAVYFNECHSPYIKKLAYFGRKLKKSNKIAQLSTTNGVVKIKITNESRWIKISHELHFIQRFPNFKFAD